MISLIGGGLATALAGMVVGSGVLLVVVLEVMLVAMLGQLVVMLGQVSGIVVGGGDCGGTGL